MKKEMLRAIEEAKTLDEAILDLYKLAVPDFDARTTVKPPKASYDLPGTDQRLQKQIWTK